jgi:hypothetical protein
MGIVRLQSLASSQSLHNRFNKLVHAMILLPVTTRSMQWTFVAASFVLSVALTTPSRPAQYAHKVAEIPQYEPAGLPRRVTPSFKIRGIQDGAVRVRQEIQEFVSDPDMLNVFLLGLEHMQGINQSDFLSYYQIAGIHGIPYVAWDNGYGPDQNPTGYCMHYSNLFVPWHRPYIALYEV